MKLKRALKYGLVHLSRFSGAELVRDTLLQARGRTPATVLLFHRVNDDIPEDGITVSTARFRTVIRAIRERYHPLTLTQLLDHLDEKTPWPRGSVVVTFDDGYLDNFSSAAPILAEYGVPATFFIVANAMGTGRVMPWEQHLQGRVTWMTWNQVRELHRQGFEVGSHTLTHPDLGKVRGAEAWREISESKTKLQDELGAPVPLFAYPFGRRANLLEENRDLVRKAGYRCCCAVVGGFVRPDSDRFDILRRPVDQHYTRATDLDYEIRTALWREM